MTRRLAFTVTTRGPGDAAAGTRSGMPEGTHETRTAFEVLTMGRIGVDIYPQQIGVSLRHVETFGKFLGGSAANVAVAAARHGRRTGLISRTGADPFGEFLHDALRGFGVDDRFVTPVAELPDAGHLLRDLPAGRLPALLLPHARRPPTWRSAPRSWTWTRSAPPTSSGSPAPACPRSPAGRPPWPPCEARGRARHHRARPGLPADVLAVPRGGPALGTAGAAARHGGRRQPRRVRHRGRGARAARPRPTRCTRPGVELAVVKQGPLGVLAGDGKERVAGAAGAGRGGQRPRRRGRVRRRALPRPARRLGPGVRRCGSATPPGRSSPPGWPAPTPCPPPTRSAAAAVEAGHA